MIAQHVVGIITRDSLFLANYDATDLPYVMAGSSVLSSLVVFTVARLMTRLSPMGAVPFLFLFSGALFVAEWFISLEQSELAAALVFLHTAALGAAVISGFWSVMNESFDPYTAKQVFGRIGTGASLGGIVGGLAAWQGSSYVSLQSMLVILAVLNAGCGVGLLWMGKGEELKPAKEPNAKAPLAWMVLKEMPYLRHLALLVIVGTMAEVTIGYVYKAHAADEFSRSADLVSFFAVVHTCVAIFSFLLQSTLARRSLQRIGIAGTVAVHTSTAMIGSFLALLFPGLATMTGLRGASGALRNSLFRSGYELFYTPLAKDKKRATKTYIDVGCSRTGGFVAAGIAMLAIAVIPADANQALMGFALTCTLLCLVIVSFLHSGYIKALAESLRSGSVKLEPGEVTDATTLKTLADTMSAMDREGLMAEIAAIRERPTIASSDSKPAVSDEVIDAIVELRSGDAQRIRPVVGEIVSSEAGHRALVTFLLPLLARTDLQRDVRKALCVLAPRSMGQLIDALTDPEENAVVRRRVPRVLGECPSQRSADGLLLGLKDERFAVRYRCAAALKKITLENPEIEISRETIIEIAEGEAKVGKQLWDAHPEVDGASSLHEPDTNNETTRKLGLSLEHVFNLLSLVLEREPLRLAQEALGSDDQGLRGTGLEYLENVLPKQVRIPLWSYLGEESVSKPKGRERTEIVKDLVNLSQVLPRR
jgi:hypothetical protein